MARPNKIEQHQLQKVVADAVAAGKSTRQIAEICSRKAREQISHAAIARYIETIDQVKKKAEVVRTSERVERIVKMDIDIIEIQYRTTAALLERFEMVDGLPSILNQRLNELCEELRKEGEDDPDYLHRWKIGFVDEMRRNIQSIAVLNRELRENSKFMADLREKAFEFKLWKEFTDLFIDAFRQRAPDVCDLVLQDIALNPRMQRIIEMQLKGEPA